MIHTRKIGDQEVDIETTRIDAKHWSWWAKVPGLPGITGGDWAPTEEMAIREAMDAAKQQLGG